MIKKTNIKGQAALVLILLSAAALIFLAITLNWGRIAQTKALISIAADESASLLASDAASYGEMQKQTYLTDTNNITEQTGVLLAIILVIVAIIVAIITPPGTFMFVIALLSVAMAAVNLVLQVVVIQPGITTLWNSLQKNQPVQQQFFEGGIASALQGSVGDQVNITDYFDWNANGQFGTNANNQPNDTVSRFAVYYTERLKMLNQKPIPAVVFFYDQLGELMNGESCDQNANDVSLEISFGLTPTPNPACASLGCADDPINPACQIKIPNSFQLNDACTASTPGNVTYNPYCDPCCQPFAVNGKATRPTSCPQPPNPTLCTNTPNDPSCVLAQCLINNPYGAAYPYMYDPAFQNYAAGLSFLDQYGRDQQMGPFTASMTLQGSPNNGIYFPNGIFPFFWLANNYSLEVDKIDPTNLQTSQVHWCVAGGSIPSSGAAPAGFPDMAQLTLPYSCTGQDCCVNYLGNSANGVIDMVGSPSFGSNPGLNASFGEGGAGSWLTGDNQMCLTTWPYNGSSLTGAPDGTCEWTNSATPPASPTPIPNVSTVDSADDTMHALSDFVDFANTLLSNDVGTLSSTFTSWYPQAANWIAPCDDGSTCSAAGQCSDGTSCGRLLSLPARLNTWSGVVSNWMNQNFTSSSAWCVPSETTLLNGNSSTTEDTYIKTNSGTTTWGDLHHVIACLNYNSNQTPAVGSVYNYQQCQTYLQSNCPGSISGTPCASSILGRSLAGAAPTYDGCRNKYAAWVSSSLTLATDEAPKFALRSLYLQDVYTRAQTMQSIFPPAATAIQDFLSGSAAQLNAAACGTAGVGTFSNGGGTCPASATSALPNSVIYGWVDATPGGGSGGCINSAGNRVGCAHIVKVTAYSPGRGGNFALSLLPWIQTTTKNFLGIPIERSYTLVDRDAPVYVSVRRWDEDHSNSILFPNGRPVWQFVFHKPTATICDNGSACTNGMCSDGTSCGGTGLPQACNGLAMGESSIGFGLLETTVQGLEFVKISAQDQASLANAFMLNDEGVGANAGKVDPFATLPGYAPCLSAANALLANAPESHICAEYVASRVASECPGGGVDCSGLEDTDYSLKFYSCSEQPEDLAYTSNLN